MINNRKLFLMVLEAGKSKIKVLEDSVSGESLLPGPQTEVSLCPPMAEGTREVCRVSFIRALISFVRAAPSWPNHLPEALTS